MNILDQIVLEKKNHLKYLSQKLNKKNNFKSTNSNSFLNAIENNLSKNKNALIAEFKRYSPSVKSFNKVRYLQDVIEQYHKSKCCCISILTDKNFGGSLNDINVAKKISNKPIIRKDFIINEAQVFETKEFGADAILLIAKILSKLEIRKLYKLANKIGLDVLIEIESILEAKKIKDIDAKLIGINNRNLKEQKIDINKSIKLSKVLNNKIIISESGVTVSNIKKIKNNSGISSFLIGGSILNNEDKVKYINKLYKA
jgi:indole-3-glycerol phosphate synthase